MANTVSTSGLNQLPSDWEVCRLDEVSSVKTGPFGAQLHERDYVEIGTPIVTVEHLSEQGLTHENLPRVSDVDKERLSQYSLEPGDIVFSRVGSVDRNSLIRPDEKGWLFSGRLLRVRPKRKRINPEFLSYVFHHEPCKVRIRRVAVGGTMPSLNTQLLSGISIQLPPLPEQKKIAEVLSTWDDAIATVSRLIESKRALKRGLMQQLLTGKRRFPGFTKPWQMVKLSDIGECIRGVSYKGAEDLSDSDNDNTYRLLRAGNIFDGEIVREDMQYVTRGKCREHQLLRDLDIAICMSSGSKHLVGKAAEFHPVDSYDYVVGAFCSIFRPSESPEASLIPHLFTSSQYKKWIHVLTAGTNINNLTPKDIETFKLKLPSDPKEISKLSDLLDQVVAEIDSLNTLVDRLQGQKRGLMQKLLTGQVRVKVDEEVSG